MQCLSEDQEQPTWKKREFAAGNASDVLEKCDETVESHLKKYISRSMEDTQLKGDEIRSEKPGNLLKAKSDSHASDATVEAAGEDDEEWKYLTGPKLTVVVVVLSLAAFTIWLDTSIVATVGLLLQALGIIADHRKGYS